MNRSNLSLQGINREDIDEVSISTGEVTSFLQLNVDSGNENNSNYSKVSNILSTLNVLSYASSKHTEYETKKSGYHFIWSENSRTGEFASTRSKQESINDTNDSDNGTRELSIGLDDSSQLLPSPLSAYGKSDTKSINFNRKTTGPTHSSIVVFMRGVYLCFQGMLTGFAFSTIFLESKAGSDAASFLENYQPNSNDFRRLLYIFSTISLVGSIDIVMTLMSQFSSKFAKRKSFGNSRSAGGFFVIAVFAALFHVIVFVLTVIMSATDTLIYIKFGKSEESDWATAASENSVVINNIKIWKGLDRVRFICALIAWGGCCLLSWRDLMILVGKETETETLYDIILLWKRRCSELEGERIDELDEVSLRQLVEIQTSGLQRTRDALQVFDSV